MEPGEGIFTIGKYKVTGTLGRGAMGVVYKAQDPEIGRTVAVKVLRSVESESEAKLQKALELFKTEARSAGNLRHPRIITVFEVSSQGSSPYIVMDYIDGEGLDQIIARQGAIPPDLALSILRQIAEGLDYAHERGVIHRDIKPSNILVDCAGSAFIVDFGVATIGRSTIESGGPVVGSPGYMSPEQILSKRLDRFSDLFSFAIVAYEVLAGVRPFDGDTFNKVITQILNNQPRPMSTLRPAFPLEVEVVFEKALAKSPASRYSRAIDFIGELERVFSRANPETRTAPAPAGFQRKPSHWGPIDVAGAVAGDRNLPSIAPSAPSTSARASSGEVHDGWSRPAPTASASRNYQQQGGNSWGRGERPGSGFDHSPESFADRELTQDGRRGWNRIILTLLAFVLIGSGLTIFWVLAFPPAPRAAERTGHSDQAAVLEPERVILPEALPSERYDIPELSQSLHTMSDRQLLGVIARGDFPIEDTLKAITLAEESNIAGRYEACIYLLANDSYVVRVEALKALARSKERRFVPAVLNSLEDHDPLVRIAAANALRDLGDRKAVSYLMARMSREELPDVKGALKRTIEKLNGYPMNS